MVAIAVRNGVHNGAGAKVLRHSDHSGWQSLVTTAITHTSHVAGGQEGKGRAEVVGHLPEPH